MKDTVACGGGSGVSGHILVIKSVGLDGWIEVVGQKVRDDPIFWSE